MSHSVSNQFEQGQVIESAPAPSLLVSLVRNLWVLIDDQTDDTRRLQTTFKSKCIAEVQQGHGQSCMCDLWTKNTSDWPLAIPSHRQSQATVVDIISCPRSISGMSRQYHTIRIGCKMEIFLHTPAIFPHLFLVSPSDCLPKIPPWEWLRPPQPSGRTEGQGMGHCSTTLNGKRHSYPMVRPLGGYCIPECRLKRWHRTGSFEFFFLVKNHKLVTAYRAD